MKKLLFVLLFCCSGFTQTHTFCAQDVPSTCAWTNLHTFSQPVVHNGLTTFNGGINTSTQLISTVITGTPPFVISSTTNIPNLNASSLNGATFSSPGSIGIGTPSPAFFTTLSISGLSTLTGTSIVRIIRDCRQDGLVADGITDDSASLNNCLTNAYANGQAVQLPSGKIKVNISINDTNKPGMNVSGVGQHQDYGTDVATQNYGTTQTEIMCNTGNICWDATGSGRQTMSNFHLRISGSYSNPSTVGALFGRDNAVSNGSSSGSGTYCFSEMNYLWKFGVYADTRPAATAVGTVGIYNVGAEQMVIEAGDYIADIPVFMSSTNDLGLTSSYQTILTGCPASMAAVHVQGGTRFQPWTKSAFDLRGPIDFDFSADVELLNGTIGTNHNPCFTFNGPIASNVFLRGQCEGFDSALTINSSSADHIVAEMAMVNPIAGLVAITAGVPITNSIFHIMQRNGTPQPFINAATGVTTIKGSEIFLGGLSGSGAGASSVTLTGSTIRAPGLTDPSVNTWGGSSAYQVFDDTGNSFIGPLSVSGQVINTLTTGTAPLVISSTTPVSNLKVQNCDTCSVTTDLLVTETTAPSGSASKAVCYADSTAHVLECSYNNGTFFKIPQTVGSGTASMTTAGITTGACGTTVTVGATGVLTTDVISFARNATATIGNGGGLTLNAWPTSGNVNFNYCNSAAGTITPTAMTVNWTVVR